MTLSIFLLILGLALTIIGANGLVDGASALAKKLKISDLVIGLTIVAFGTSAPELTVSIYSALQGTADIAIGNIAGSNTLNVFLILGLTAIIAPLSLQQNTVWKEIPFSLLAALALLFMANDIFLDNSTINQITRSEGLILLGFFAIFLIYAFEISRKGNKEIAETQNIKVYPVWLAVLFVLAGLGGLIMGGKYIVDGAVNIARIMGMSESVIGLTIVAIGTSLPELATSIVAAFKNKCDIAVGNVVGSNIFNIFLILGTTASIKTLPIGNITNLDLLMVVFASLLLFVFTFTFSGRKINRSEGVFLLLIYIAYMINLVYKA